MAFGQTRAQEAKQAEKKEGEQQGTGQAWPYIPLKASSTDERSKVLTTRGGLRRIRMLPALDEHGNLVEIPATDRYGKVLRGKMTTVPASEVRFVEVWWPHPFIVAGKEKKMPVWIDWESPARWNNPLWEIAKETDKGSKERTAFKEHFLLNVVDKTPVIIDEHGYPVYPDEKNQYRITALGTVLDKPIEGEPEPLNQVRILKGTSGRTDPPGKHFYQSFVNLIGVIEHEENSKLVYLPHEFDISVNVTGADKFATRAVNAMLFRKPLPDELVFAPRYDLAEWVKPWPNDALQDLLDGKDYVEVMKSYNILQYPQLKPVRTSEPTVAATEAASEEDEDLFAE